MAMAHLIPRLHLFEIDDQPWFPSKLRQRVQDALTVFWSNALPPLQRQSPASIAASVLISHFRDSLPAYTFVDFCAGGGGPTPFIEGVVNTHLRKHGHLPVDFLLTDLHPNVAAWDLIAKKNEHVTYDAEPVDASRAPPRLVKRGDGKKTMRLFNLAFHHFDDASARAILRDTVETSDGLAIFEMQDRSVASALTNMLILPATLVGAPLYAWKWRSPLTLFFSWGMPILPFVLAFDGYVSSLRTRTPEEIERLLRTCGADSSGWEVWSGRERHLWPCGYLNWVICRPTRAS